MKHEDADRIAKEFHDAYESIAPLFGYVTAAESAVPWDEVPQSNKNVVIATVKYLVDGGVIAVPTRSDNTGCDVPDGMGGCSDPLCSYHGRL